PSGNSSALLSGAHWYSTMPRKAAMRWRSRRAFSSSESCSVPGSTSAESTSRRASPLAMSYSHRSSWKRSLSLPRRKVTRLPSGAIAGFIRLGPLSGSGPVMASRVSRSAWAGAVRVMAASRSRVRIIPELSGEVTAIHRQAGAGEVAGGGRNEEEHGRGDLAGLGHARQRDHLHHHVHDLRIAGQGRGELRVGQAGQHRVDAD